MNNSKEIRQHIKCFKEDSASSFLALLVLADLVFIVLDSFGGIIPIFSSTLYSLGKDGGYPEIYQYVKEFWIVLLMLSVYLKTKEIGHILWVMVFAYLLFDDAIRIHERVGSIIAKNLDFTPIFGLRPQDFGELAVTVIALVLLLTPIGFFYLRASSMFKKITRDLLLLLLIIGFFGVFVDMVGIVVSWPQGRFLLGIIEDGGEMIAISMLAWYVFLLNIRNGHASFSVCGLLSTAIMRRSS